MELLLVFKLRSKNNKSYFFWTLNYILDTELLILSLTIGVEWSNVAELVDSDILSDAITFIQLETSIGVLCAPLLGGYISDKTGDYSYVFYIAGILLYSSAACAIAGKL